jgi:type I restriction enzyme S subunit
MTLNGSTTKKLYETIPQGSWLWLQSGDLLVQRSNTLNLVGTAAVYNGPPDTYVYPDLMMRIRLCSEASNSWVWRYMNSPYGRVFFQRMAAGSSGSMPKISGAKLREMPILLPPLSEQQRIAAVLDRADELRAKRRAALSSLSELAQAVFLDMFGDPATNPRGWRKPTVDDFAEVQGGLQVSSARRNCPNEVPYLRVANVFRGFLDLREIKVLRATDAEIDRTILVQDDLLVVEGHGNPLEIGRCALWDGSIPHCVHQNHLIRVRFREEVVPLYACMYLNSPGGRRHLLRAGKTTSGLNTISVSEVRATPIALPPVHLQKEFARRVAMVERLKAVHRASLAEMDALFASLQHRAFRGEL